MKTMPYIICTKKKSRPKVSIEICERCKGMKCLDYRDYIQPTLFPFFVQDKRFRKTVRVKREKPVPHPDQPEQLLLI
jgi:hypothetical protein